jgi:hypothetical protein
MGSFQFNRGGTGEAESERPPPSYNSEIESLDGFETVYNRQPSSNDGPKNTEPTFVRHGNRKDMKERFSVAYSQHQQNVNSQLFTNDPDSHFTL